MIRKLIFALLLLTLPAFGTTYYVAASGSDTNNGTTNTTPWLHAPGMPACTSVCASTVINAGDSIILRGGDTWHYGTGTPSTGGTWAFTRSGTAGNPIYIGVDQKWFTGTAWTRPKLSGDNAPSTGFPAVCAFPDDSLTYFTVSGSYVTADNIEVLGDCQHLQSFVAFVNLTSAGNHRIISGWYFHGWTLSAIATDDRKAMLNSGDTSNPPTDIATGNIFDGSDSSGGAVCTVPSCVKSP